MTLSGALASPTGRVSPTRRTVRRPIQGRRKRPNAWSRRNPVQPDRSEGVRRERT